MINGCIFCSISKGETSSHKIYEDDLVFAFLDIHPINPGHILVVPKKHEADFYNLDDESYAAVFNAVKKLSEIVNIQMGPHKVGLIVAGWDIPHAHIHVVPMHDYHDITSKALLEGKKSNPSEEELEVVAKKFKDAGL